jgi:hypothetical protein
MGSRRAVLITAQRAHGGTGVVWRLPVFTRGTARVAAGARTRRISPARRAATAALSLHTCDSLDSGPPSFMGFTPSDCEDAFLSMCCETALRSE